jgi:hypothetical protein
MPPVDTIGIVMQTNKGDGTFQQADSYYNPAISPSFLAVQDIDNDGRDDIVTANGDSISVSLGKGNGTFHNPITSTLSNATSLAIDDFNHDGMNDIAVIGNNTNSLTILLGSGNGRNGD